MMTLVNNSQNVISEKYYEQCPALIDNLTAIIAAVKAGCTIPTGINGVISDEDNAVIYDARGRRVKNISSSGVYIINGKKTYVK